MKYPVGTEIHMTNPETGEGFVGHVIDMNDERMKGKIAFSGDVCVWFPELEWRTTYDPEFLDAHAKILNQPPQP